MSQFHSFSVPVMFFASMAGWVALEPLAPEPEPDELHPAMAAAATTPRATVSRVVLRPYLVLAATSGHFLLITMGVCCC